MADLCSLNQAALNLSSHCENCNSSRGGAAAQREQLAAIRDAVKEAQGQEEAPSSSLQSGNGQEQGRVTAQDIRMRIQHVKAAVDGARAANRPDVLRNEVAHLMLSSVAFQHLEARPATHGIRKLAPPYAPML